MRFHNLGVKVAVGAVTLASAVLVGPNAYAKGGGRPCGPAVSTSGVGSLGTGWTLKSMYDDDGAVPGVVVGEEFQINTEAAGQVWHVQLADNGLVFFDQQMTSTAAGITAMGKTADQNRTDQHMTAVATRVPDGETIDPAHGAQVTLAGPPPARCGVGAG
jgi:hypothetical protein